MQTYFEIEYDYDFDLLGVIAPMKEHKLAWNFERQFNFEFEPKEEFELDFLKDGKLTIANYVYEEEYSSMRLIRNKAWESEKISPYLLPEVKQFDYLLMVKGNIFDLELSTVQDKIKAIPNVMLVQNIEIEGLKSKENLIFE